MRVFELAGAQVELHDDGLTVSRYGAGEVPACAQEDEAYRARAVTLGYGADTFAMSREHELAHHLLAHWLGLSCSPTLAGVAARDYSPNWKREEAAVLAVQAYARAVGVDLEGLFVAAVGAGRI